MEIRMEILSPIRVSRTYTQSLIASPEKVFPLLCPVREIDWVNDWDPRFVISASGLIESDCVFVMPDEPDDSIWIVTQWNPDLLFVEFVKVTPGFTVGKIDIQLRPGKNEQTLADITYCFTALSPKGSEFVNQFSEDYYESFMKEWEAEINHFLSTGRRREVPANNL
jgi:hypothetical protein